MKYPFSLSLKDLSRARVITLWFVLVAVAIAANLLAGSQGTPGTWALLLLVSLVPPAISFAVWNGAPPPTVAEVLYAVREPGGR